MFNLGRPGDADAVLREAHDRVGEEACREELTLLRTEFFTWTNMHREALHTVAPLLIRRDMTDRRLLRAITAAASPLNWSGRFDEALLHIDRGLRIARRLADELPLAASYLILHQWFALAHSGRISEGATLVEQHHQAAMQARQFTPAAGLAMVGIYSAIEQGRIQTARRRGSEAAPLMRKYDVYSFLPFALAASAQAAALVGDLAAAEVAMVEAVEVGQMKILRPWILRGQAWIAAARGEISSAQALALEGAASAREPGQNAVEALLLHEAVRLGAAARVVERLTEVATLVDGRLASTFAAHARALVGGDGIALDMAAGAFADMGSTLLAAEAATEAVVCHRDAGLPARAAASAARAQALAAQCEGARTPALATLVLSGQSEPRRPVM